jgi:hypothetical protein
MLAWLLSYEYLRSEYARVRIILHAQWMMRKGEYEGARLVGAHEKLFQGTRYGMVYWLGEGDEILAPPHKQQPTLLLQCGLQIYIR